MAIKDTPASEITDPKTYLNRRTFMRAGVLVASTAATGWIYRRLNSPRLATVEQPPLANLVVPTSQPSAEAMARAFVTNEKRTPLEDITHYNNFYEFSTAKQEVAEVAANFVSRPWKVTVGGLARKPREFDLDDLLKIAPAEERVYRMRCVEGWSMVIPWNGFSLSKLLEQVEPLSDAKFVAFATLLDPQRMQNQRTGVLDWPYIEGLRMDEAMHPLTILASGIYGRQLPPQDGAPLAWSCRGNMASRGSSRS
jgi:sulfoxide reductase catalytic subunit YedY